MKYVITDGNNADFISLCHMLDEYLNSIAGGEANRSEYIQYNKLDDIKDVVLAYENDIALGCASFKYYNDTTAEIKRVYVDESYRGRGIAKKLIGIIEDIAKKKGYSKLILETGEPLVEATSLYKSIGFKIIPNYGCYNDMTDCICMEKYI